MISVDTDTSTNDLMMVFSTGAVVLDLSAPGACEQLSALLSEASVELAKMVARDGEGATKLIEVALCGAANDEEAKQLALSVINSPLVKTAIHGSDPNWGRIIAALGKVSCVALDPARVDLKFGEIEILRKCEMVCSDLSLAANALRGPEVCIKIDLNIGTGTATAWGCDLTKGYIDINTAYN